MPDRELRAEFATTAPPPRERTPFTVWITLAALVLVLIATMFLFHFAQEAADAQKAGEQRGYQNRAAICAIQRDIGADLDPVCLSKNVTAYYNPRKPSTSNASKSRGVTCDIALTLGVKTATVRDVCD